MSLLIEPWPGLLVGLAIYRLTLMLTSEHGPGHIFERLRLRLGVTYDVYSQPQASGFWSELILCPWCVSLWIAVGYIVLTLLWPTIMLLLAQILAASGLVVILTARKEN